MSDISLSVDAVILGYENNGLFILLIQRKNEPFKDHWALPGGFVEVDETLEHAAKRELEEETSIRISHLHQVYAFGEPNRDPRSRVVSIAYVGIVRKDLHEPKANDDAKNAQWIPINQLPQLAFDHHEIIKKSIDKLISIIDTKSTDVDIELSEKEWGSIKRLIAI